MPKNEPKMAFWGDGLLGEKAQKQLWLAYSTIPQPIPGTGGGYWQPGFLLTYISAFFIY